MKTQFDNRKGSMNIFLGLTAVLAAISLVANAGEPFELMTHHTYVSGKEEVDTGKYEAGIAKLEKKLTKALPHSLKTPALIDLCVAYTIQREIDQATVVCDKAMESGWYSGLAYNNRGVLQIAKGNYEQAIRDFEEAIRHSGADAMAKRNLGRAQARLAEVRSREQNTAVAALFETQ